MDRKVEKDAETFGKLNRSGGGWVMGLLVARSCRNEGVGHPRNVAGATKTTFAEFARSADVHVSTVSRYFKAWTRAAAADLVPVASDLRPGQDVELPDADQWAQFHTGGDRSTGTSHTDAARSLASNPEKVIAQLSPAELQKVEEVIYTKAGQTLSRAITSDDRRELDAYDYLLKVQKANESSLKHLPDYVPDTDLRAEARLAANSCEATTEFIRAWASGKSIADEVAAFLGGDA